MNDSAPGAPLSLQRQLAAIVFTDVVGYSAHMQRDEQGTIRLIRTDFERMRALAGSMGGTVLNSMGDGLMLSFPSAVNAVDCALRLQAEFERRSSTAKPGDPVLQHRIGIHVGDVLRLDDGSLSGDGVNIAARLEPKALPGGICVSQTVFDTVKGKLPMQAAFAGPMSFKNIAESIPVWRLAAEGCRPPEGGVGASQSAAAAAATTGQRRKFRWIAAGALIVLSAASFLIWRLPVVRKTAKDSEVSNILIQKPSPDPARRTDPRSIAVLAFENLSAERDNEFFSDGISEELLDALAKIPGLRVSARTSAFSFKGKNLPVPEIGSQLGVAYIVEGSVRKSEKRMRIKAQLVNAADGFQIWSETFDRELRDILAVQDELARTIVERLHGRIMTGADDAPGRPGAGLLPKPVKASQAGSTQNTEAYGFHLQGRFLLGRASHQDLRKAVDHFVSALALDPSFALAWVGLAQAHMMLAGGGVAESREAYEQARAAAEKALALAPDLPEAHAALAQVQMNFDWDWRAASDSAKKALALAPSNAQFVKIAARLARKLGHREESVSLSKQAILLDPLDSSAHLECGLAHLWNLRFEEAEPEIRRAIELNPSGLWNRLVLGQLKLLQGRFDEALVIARQINDEDYRATMEVMTLHGQGKTSQAAEAAAKLKTRARARHGSFQLAEAYAFMGRADDAFALLQQAFDERDTGLSTLKRDPFFLGLHNDPRWKQLLSKLQLDG